jgi:hypothetical protein
MIRSYRYSRYEDEIDLMGKDLISLTDAPREAVKSVIPFLRDPREMRRRWAFTRKLLTYSTGEIADEVHEFLNATQGSSRLKSVFLRKGRVIQLTMKY